MRLYRVHLTDGDGNSAGYVYTTSRRAAGRKAAQDRQIARSCDLVPRTEIQTIEVTPTRDGIVSALNKYAGHPDNG